MSIFPKILLAADGSKDAQRAIEAPHDPPQSVEDLAQVVLALRGVFSEECQVGGNKCPLFV